MQKYVVATFQKKNIRCHNHFYIICSAFMFLAFWICSRESRSSIYFVQIGSIWKRQRRNICVQ